MQNESTLPLIDTKQVSQNFISGQKNIKVLSDVNVNIPENSFSIVFGPSGSGKSTLLNVLAGLQQPTKGKVSYRGKDIYEMSSDSLAQFRASKLGMIHQLNYWVMSLTVQENVALPLYFLGYDRRQAARKAAESLEHVGMLHHASKLPSVLSVGEQQRVAMARALITDPELIVADEPTGNLDSASGDKIMNILVNCQKNLNRTVVLVTHSLEYLPLGDNLMHIQDGKIKSIQGDDIGIVTQNLVKDMLKRIKDLSKKEAGREV